MRMMLGREASAAAAWTIVGRARDSATAAKARVVKVGLMGIRGVRVVAMGRGTPNYGSGDEGFQRLSSAFKESRDEPGNHSRRHQPPLGPIHRRIRPGLDPERGDPPSRPRDEPGAGDELRDLGCAPSRENEDSRHSSRISPADSAPGKREDRMDQLAVDHVRAVESLRPYLCVLARMHLDRRLWAKLDPEDLVQATFQEALEHWDQFLGDGHLELKGWL